MTDDLFKDIQVGDYVLQPTFIRTDFHDGRTFNIKTKVIRTTKTQLITKNGCRYRKSDGYEIGSEYRRGEVFMINAPYYCNSERTIRHYKDETKECKSFLDRLKVIDKLNDALHNFKLSKTSDIDIEEIKKLTESLESFKAKM